MSLTIRQRTDAFIKLGQVLHNPDAALISAAMHSRQRNAWFTEESVNRAFASLAQMLDRENLENWLQAYDLENTSPKTVGLVLAGNIPLVGFHDVLCVLISGNRAQIKLSADDSVLLPAVLEKLTEIEAGFKPFFQLVDRLKDFDAVIATGSNNTARYFEYYFGKYPHIIRKNRTSVGVLSGSESTDAISRLGHDIFDYFGLGCRNVSKIFVPKDYTFDRLFEPLEMFSGVLHHHKYNNNYDYQKSILLINRVDHFDNGFLLVKQDEALVSPLAVLHYERYDALSAIENRLREQQDGIQCVVSSLPLDIPPQIVDFGDSQNPGPADYADDVDTLQFLTTL
ncbi:MAG: acyl-CoA reductase [Mucilaginibacter polytrichastri]|nr:acyl-CoA reductase [Mucilaginibacter polytrichastri]